MTNERRGDRRQPSRPGGGGTGHGEFRPYRSGGRPGGFRPGGERPGGERPGGERPGGERAGFRPRPQETSTFRPRPQDDGGMAIRIDPRRLGLLKELAGEAGLRPGQLVQRWVEERLDAERAGGIAATPEGGERLDRLETAVAELTERVAALAAVATAAAPIPAPSSAEAASDAAAGASAPATTATPRRRGRPRGPAAATATAPRASRRRTPTTKAAKERVPLHEEISAVIRERGPLTAAELATAIGERGRYAPPRSSKPLDAAAVNSRVSNPVYRSRFTRADGRIGLAE